MKNIFLIIIFVHITLLGESSVPPKIFYIEKLQSIYRSSFLAPQAHASKYAIVCFNAY